MPSASASTEVTSEWSRLYSCRVAPEATSSSPTLSGATWFANEGKTSSCASMPSSLKYPLSIARKNGVRYAFTGNIHDPEGDSTYCHACGEKLIARDWFTLRAWHLDANGCCRRNRCSPGLTENKRPALTNSPGPFRNQG